MQDDLLPVHHHKQLLLSGTNLPGDATMGASADPKPRLRWTPDLHDRFVDAVTQLGGAETVWMSDALGIVPNCQNSILEWFRAQNRMDGYKEEGSSSQDRQSTPTVHEVGEGSSQAEEGFPHAAFSITGIASPGTLFGAMQSMVPNPMYANIGFTQDFRAHKRNDSWKKELKMAGQAEEIALLKVQVAEMSAVLAKPQVKDFLKTLEKGKEKGKEQRKEHDVNAHAVTAEGEPSKKPWEEDIPELSSPSYSPPTSFSYSSNSSSSSNPRKRRKKATPKSVMKIMNVKGLTLYHLKSHLQKYRLSKQPQKDTTKEATKEVHTLEDVHVLKSSLGPQNANEGEEITNALKAQMDLQKQLQEQLETIPLPMSNAGCFGGGSVFQAMIRPSPALHGFMTDNAYGAMQAGRSNPMYGNIGVQPGFQCAAGSYGMPGANMAMAGFS
ncbi:hypothetical protein L7F22_016877 [Adiantum nelumboides]|nr:hypothetical protein [Adiantum nelumboides]